MGRPDVPTLEPRERLLLLFLAAGDQELDPVRIQKGLFILAQKAPAQWLPNDARYEFKPYNYGPFAQQIYTDLQRLRAKGYVKTGESWNPSWRFHSVSGEGVARAGLEAESMEPKFLLYIEAVRKFVTDRSFRELLDTIYREFPKYAVNSVFQR